jgi:hypothetical protein
MKPGGFSTVRTWRATHSNPNHNPKPNPSYTCLFIMVPKVRNVYFWPFGILSDIMSCPAFPLFAVVVISTVLYSPN